MSYTKNAALERATNPKRQRRKTVTIYQKIIEGQSYGRLIQQVTRRDGKWLYRYCMYSGGPVRFARWMPSEQTTGNPARIDPRTAKDWNALGYTKLERAPQNAGKVQP